MYIFVVDELFVVMVFFFDEYDAGYYCQSCVVFRDRESFCYDYFRHIFMG